jgi:nucleotide-binding universal stress UspA family protein
MHTILAAVDFSSVTQRVVDAAAALARVIDARVILLNVVQPPMVVTELAPLAGDTLKFTGEVERAARQRLSRLKSALLKRGVEVDTRCEQGSPVVVIVSHATKLKARYIVLGSHGHTSLHDLVMGGTASGVLKRSPCPVAVVPARVAASTKRSRKQVVPRTKRR